MKKLAILITLLFISIFTFSQSRADRFVGGKVICTQTGAGVNTFTVSCNFTDEGGLFDGTNVTVGDYLYFTDGGYGYYLPIDSILSSGPVTVIIRVESTGTGLGAVPSVVGYICEGSEHYEFFPYISGISNADQQVASENAFYILDSLLYFRLPERISGTSPPAYTPTSDQSWIAQSNGDGKLYRYDPILTDWIEIGGVDTLNGIYSGSDTVPTGTVAFIDSTFGFYGDDGRFTAQIGELAYGKLVIDDSKFEAEYTTNFTGTNKITITDNGIVLNNHTQGSPNIELYGPVLFNRVLTPSSIGSNQNNYSPSGFPSANFVRLSSSANVNITGFGTGNGRIGRIILLHNIGSFNITLKNQSGSSLAANRFAMSDDWKMSPNDLVIAHYDTTSSRWRIAELPRQYVDSLSMTNGILRISLFNDKTAHKELDITENIQDIVGAMIGAQTNIAVTYNDGTGLISYVASGGGGGGGGSVIPDTFQIFNDSLYLSFLLDSISASIVDLTEYRQDLDTFRIVNDTLQASIRYDNVPYSFVDLTSYLDNTDNQRLDTFEISGAVISGSILNDAVPASTINITESVQDITGAMVTGNTETGITVTYDDADGTLDFVTTDVSATNEIQRLDTFEIVSNILRASLLNDGVPFSSVDLTPYTVNIYNANGVQDDLSRYFQQDSTMEFFMGQFANIPDLNYDGTEKGYYYSPDYLGEVGLINGNGTQGDYANLSVTPDNITIYSQDGNNAVRTSANLRIRPDAKTNDMLLSAAGVTKINGISRIIQAFNDTIDYIAIGHDGTGGNTRAYMTVGTGGNNANFFDKSNRRKFSWQYQKAPLNNPYLLLEGRIPATSVDTTADALWFYNGSYGWDNSRPVATNGIMSFHYWKGNATNTTPGFITMAQLADSVGSHNPTIYTDDGTVDSREIEIDNFLNFVDNNGDGEFNVSIGSTAGGNLFLTGVESKINYFDANGISTISADGSGVEVSTTHALDPITINSANDVNLSAIDITGTVTGNVIFTNNSAATNERFAVSYDNGVSSTNSLQVKEGVGIWLQSSENNIILEGQTLLADVVSPSTIGSSQNNYTGLNGANFGRLDASTAVNITGLDNGYAGRILPTVNISNTAITFVDNSGGSNVENRIDTRENVRLNNNDIAFWLYDTLSTKWRLLGTNIGSPYTNSGRLLNGRSGDLIMSYMTDTLNDVSLGYGFTLPTADEKSDYNKFGLVIDGDGGFQIAGKETYIKGASFDSLNTARIAARESSFDLTTYKRNSVGGAEDIAALYGVSRNSVFFLNNDVTHYYDTGLSLHKDWSGTPSNRKDYGALVQEGEYDGSSGDTSSVVVWWGIPQITDTVTSFSAFNGISAVSKERGFGVQSVFDLGSTLLKYDWMKIKMGNVATDTANTSISFYGNSYYLPNDKPSTNGCDTCIWILTGDGSGQSHLIDLHDLIDNEGGGGGSPDGNGIYGGDGNIPSGGSQVTMDAIGETVRFVMNTGNTTLREMVRLETVENAFTRFFVLKGPSDSLRVFRASAGREYTMQTYGGTTFSIATDSIIKLIGDSLLITENIAPESGEKVRYILGLTSQYYAKRIIAEDPGDIFISDGTDWKRGTLAANESNVPTTIRPAQITATTNDWNPTGYSTTRSQYIELSGDASFRTITGLTAATRDGVTKTLSNTGTNCLVIAKLHTSSSSGNRFNLQRDVVMYPNLEVTFRYDSVGAAWKLVSSNKADISYGNMVETTLSNNTGTTTDADNPSYAFTANGGSFSANTTPATATPKRRTNVTTSTVATSFPTLTTRNGNGLFYQVADKTYIRIYAKIKSDATNVSTDAESYEIKMGFEENTDTVISHGALITYHHRENSGNWVLKTTDSGGSTTPTNSAIAFAADTWYDLELIYYPYGEVTAFINGTRYTSTSTLPTAVAVEPFLQIDKDNGITARTYQLVSFDNFFVRVSEQ